MHATSGDRSVCAGKGSFHLAVVHSIPPSHRHCSFHLTIPPLLFIPSHHPTAIVHSILPSHHYCSFHPTIPPLLFIPSHRYCSFHPAAIVHSIPPSHRYEHFHPDPAWLNPSCSSSPPMDKLKPLQD